MTATKAPTLHEMRSVATSHSPQPRVYIDLTHLGRHVTGLERISIEQFQVVSFEGADVHHVTARGILSMILHQQVVLPLLALLHPNATFVFPGFPPSPAFTLIPDRVVMYMHDLFLITRRADLGRKARIYMAPSFSLAVRRLKRFLVNSEKTRAELQPFARTDAAIGLYRPVVRNVFAASADGRAAREAAPAVLEIATLGTVEPRKNYAAMIPILDALEAAGQKCKLHVIGREGWGAAREALAGDPRVTIHGYQPAQAVKTLLEKADLYLCTSHDEGLGLPLLEAQFAGLPVVAPDAPVFREVLAASGTFIDTAAPTAAAVTIRALTSASDWRAKTSITARANVARWNSLAADDAALARFMFAQKAQPISA